TSDVMFVNAFGLPLFRLGAKALWRLIVIGPARPLKSRMLSAPAPIVPPSTVPESEPVLATLNVSGSGTFVPAAPPLMLPTLAKLNTPLPTPTLVELVALLVVRMLL